MTRYGYQSAAPAYDTALVLPIGVIGPEAPSGPGAVSVNGQDRKQYTKIEGEKIKPAPLIPPEIDMSEEQKRRLEQYIWNELESCRNERWQYMEKLARLKLKYRTKFPEFPKDFPIPNSSQITIPVIKTNTDTLTSRLFQTVMAATPLASVRTKDEDFQDFANDWELFLDLYDQEKLELEDVLDTALTECIKLGTSVVEITRYLEKKKMVTFDSTTLAYNQKTEEVYNGPIVYNIPIEDFWIRPAYQDPQKAPWCGKELRPTWAEIKGMALSGELDSECIDYVWRLPVSPGDIPKTQRQEEEIEQLEPEDYREYRIFELCVRWDVDGDGIDEEIIVYYHWESHRLLRCKFNTFKKGRRPYEVFRYKKIEYRFYAEGVAEILEQLQEEISTQHNQRIDNATIASLKLILTGRAVPGLRPGDALWPGKIVKAKPEDVSVMALGEIYPSTITNEQISQGYVREVSGVSEAAIGSAQPVSRTTAAAQLSLLEETNRRYDKTLKSFRKTIRGIHVQLTDLFNQTGTGGLAEMWLGAERGQRLEEYITLPAELLGSKIKIQVTSTKATVNREVEMQTNIALMNLIIQNGQQLLALCQQLAPQALPMVAHLLISSIKPVYKKVLQYADSPNPDEGIRILAFMESILPSPEDMGGMAQQAQLNAAVPGGQLPAGSPGGPGAGGDGSAPTANLPQRMADLMQTLGQLNGRQSRVARQRAGR